MLSNQKRKKTGLSRERGINGQVRERLAGLCRVPMHRDTALASRAIFAVTDDQHNKLQIIHFTNA